MQRVRRYRVVSIMLSVAAAAFVALTACSNYEEGDRCEILNGNEDCVDGLQCTPKALINTPYNSSDRCCPVNRSTATHPACTLLQNPIAGDSAPPPDTGPAPDAADAADAADTSVVDAADAADADEGG